MKSTQVTAASLLFTICYGSPFQVTNGELVEKRQGPGSYFAITGPTGGVQPRLEIRDLEKTGEMWNLYLLAMTEFQAMDQHDIASYYQIAGIHGMPWQPWDGVLGSLEGRNEAQKGYCPHFQLLFGTWHRPYLTLFEQQLQIHAKSIASQFPTSTRSTYQDAANKLRVPFWDWAKAIPASQPVLPTALTNEKVQVTFPNGTATQIDNPLYDYNFHPLNATEIDPEGCKTTFGRDGPVGGKPEVCRDSLQTVRAAEVVSDHKTLDNTYRRILPSQRSTLMTLLSQYSSFNSFSNDGSCARGRKLGSIEVIHNPIHTSTWPGHMSPASVSAFDPMFWLHHANVDRQMALFQALYPETYMEPCAADSPTYTIEKGDMLDENSPLTPFHINAQGDWWTSANSRNTRDMGYTYPELASNPSNASLINTIKSLYSGPADGSTTTKSKSKRQDSTPTKGIVYLAEVKLPIYGLKTEEGGSAPYNVLIFLGDVPSNPKDWLEAGSFVGPVSTLGGLKMQSDQTSTSIIDLTLALEKAGKKSDEAAAQYLKDNLHWRIGLGDFEIPKEEVNGVEVRLISSEVEISHLDTVFDKWVGEFVEHAPIL